MRKRIRTRVRRASALALAMVLAGLALAPTALAADEGRVTVVHAVPDLTVDAYANDCLLLEDFTPGSITRAFRLEPGSYELDVTPANSSDVVLSATAPVTDDTDAAAVAYLDEGGSPKLGLFPNDQRPVAPRKARVTVRHTAAAPAVDVRFKRIGGEWKYVTGDLENGEQATRPFRERSYRFDVVLAGTKQRVLGPVTVELERLRHVFVYAWGSASDDNLALNSSIRRLTARP